MVKKQQQSNKQNPNDQKQKIRLFLAGSRILDLQHSRLGTLSKDDDDGSETVGKKKKNLRSFKVNRVYLDLLNINLVSRAFPSKNGWGKALGTRLAQYVS